MAINIYARNVLTGGGSKALDALDGLALYNSDIAITFTQDYTYIHYLDEESGAAENSPYVIEPDNNAENKRWLLIGTTEKDIRDYINTISGSLQTQITDISTEEVEEFTLDASDISNKYIDLSYAPVSNDKLLIFVEHGIKGILNTDYSISNNRISWSGKEFDGVLEAGDTLNCLYWF